MTDTSSDTLASLDQALSNWRQGDVAFPDDLIFVHLADLRCPITAEARALAAELDPDIHGVATEIEGVVILTQTCDIIRPWKQRPFVEVAPLVRVDEGYLEEIKKGWRPSYAWIASISETKKLVADLDRVMTVEKAVLSSWTRIQGCLTDQDARQFAEALARKRARRAFPDDFNEASRKLQTRIRSKHGKNSIEGRMLRGLREIRIRAAPSWHADTVSVFIWFVKNDNVMDIDLEWSDQLQAWFDLVDWAGRFEKDGFIVCDLEDLSAKDFEESDRLDLDYLSVQGGNGG